MRSFLFMLVVLGMPVLMHAQQDTTVTVNDSLFIVTTNSGAEFIGKILRQDAREILIVTKDKGEVIIPKFEVKEIKALKPGEINEKGTYVPNEVFSTRYSITTNGLPIEKGESYILWNLWGPDFEFGVGRNLGLGVMTSWVGFPIIGTAKYTIPLEGKLNLGLGLLGGSGTWIDPEFGLLLPYGSVTIGDRRSNFTFSGGYGAVFAEGSSEGRFLCSVAFMQKMGRKVSFVFDSFIMPRNQSETGLAILIPCIRLQTESNKAFQFGFGGMIVNGDAVPAPFPFVQWFRKL